MRAVMLNVFLSESTENKRSELKNKYQITIKINNDTKSNFCISTDKWTSLPARPCTLNEVKFERWIFE